MGDVITVQLQNTTMTFRLPKEVKNKFTDITKKNNLPTALVLRKLISQYIKDDGKGIELC